MNTPDLSQTPIAADGTFEVQLQKSGQILQVTKDQSILKVLQDAGHDVPFSCSEGICGTCLTQVVAGTPEDFAATIRLEMAKWGKLIRERKITMS